MKPQPEPSTQEVLAGLVERVTYHNAENGFCVCAPNVACHTSSFRPGDWRALEIDDIMQSKWKAADDGAEIVVLLGGIAGLIFSASKYRSSVDTEALWSFVLLGIVLDAVG